MAYIAEYTISEMNHSTSYHDLSVQLTCLINDSAGVIATNTAAVQLANARDKPWCGRN